MLVVGLGNPGPTYSKNRHNIGFVVIDELVKKLNANKSSTSFDGELFKYQNHFLLKPLTFMNLSGESVSKVKRFYKIDEVVVIHDDLDLPFGTLRFKRGGGDGGHNGLKSITQKIGKDYIRVRMGIGKPQHKGEVISYVLGDFTQSESSYMQSWIAKCCEAVEFLMQNSLEDTSCRYSVKKFKIE